MNHRMNRPFTLLLALLLCCAPFGISAGGNDAAGSWALTGLKSAETDEVLEISILAEGWALELKQGGEGTMSNVFLSLPLTWEQQAAEGSRETVTIRLSGAEGEAAAMAFELKDGALQPLPGVFGPVFGRLGTASRERVDYKAAIPAAQGDFTGSWVLRHATSTHYASGNQVSFLAEEMMGEGYAGLAALTISGNTVLCAVPGMEIDNRPSYFDGRSLHVLDAKTGAGFSFFMAEPDVLHMVYLVPGGEAVLVFHRAQAESNP